MIRVFFNASVILAGFNSPHGGSAKLLSWIEQKIILGVASEVILDEVVRRSNKINLNSYEAELKVNSIFKLVIQPPKEINIRKFNKFVEDPGDAHVLASSYEIKADYLVTLDKKQLLVLAEKVRDFKIVTPGQLIEKIQKDIHIVS